MSITKRESILRRDPYTDRRSFVARAMGLSPIGDIASGGLSESTSSETITWETASDWDSAVSEAGVVHEATGDYPGGGTVQLGYPAFDRGGTNLLQYHPIHDGYGGGTFADVSGNNYDASVTGTTSATGLHNQTTAGFDGNDDEASSGDVDAWDGLSTITLLTWVYPTGAFDGANYGFWGKGTGGNEVFNYQISSNDNWRVQMRDSSGTYQPVSNSSNTTNDTWHALVARYDNGEITLIVDDTSNKVTGSQGSSLNSNSVAVKIGEKGTNGWYFPGRIAVPMAFDRALSDAEIQDWIDAGTGGNLETATKSFSSQKTPDLQNLTYSLNGQTIDLKIIGSPGTASEEVVTQTLDGASSYSLTWSNSHSDFRLRPEFSTTTVEASPTFSKGELIG